MHPPPNPQQQREEQMRREQSRQEELIRKELERKLVEFDAHAFYSFLQEWVDKAVPKPIPYSVHLTPNRRRVIMHQPMPLTRKQLIEMRRISASCARLLSLLRAVDQKGLECPYIHQTNRIWLERAIDKCERINRARKKYLKKRGFWARLGQMMNIFHLDSVRRDSEFFKKRLEAVLMMCRQQEFSQDLMRLRQSVLSREMLGSGQAWGS